MKKVIVTLAIFSGFLMNAQETKVKLEKSSQKLSYAVLAEKS